ncbi:class I adenylate-forming enzyme family protein [Falsiroseomonas sp.]|uniref:class I adenylate-forming enzyme family protein n=1 Tax=Falsiroseomonas sp. TaxID=2870721 RepID=UPI00271C0531|nr:AMP-binding protein [Falsiroseomonas sp.]MDO9499152.1 AMP-binding protein [Falsiroseomonas sp.]
MPPLTATLANDPVLAAHAAMRARIEAPPFAASLGAFVDAAAAAHGAAPLWRFIDAPDGLPLREISYAGLAEATRRVASGLAQAGVRRGDRVGVMLPNIPAFPITWLALARLGAIMIPVNTGYTARELDYVLGDGGASHLVVHEDALPALEELLAQRPILAPDSIHVVGRIPQGMRDWMALLDGDPGGPPGAQPGLDDLVNLQYTSGTTGFPKGCMLAHRYWLTLGRVAAGRGGDVRVVLAAQPFYYMDPQWLLLMAMHLGGRFVVAPRPSATRFMDWVRREGVEYCIFPQIVLKQPESPDDSRNALKRVSIFGLRSDMHAAMERRFGCVARESFGMTEIGSGLTTPPEAVEMIGSGTCGLPSPFREASIRDADGRELGAGEIGELWIRGPGILKGYWNKPEANAEAFREGGWFRTGDLFRRDARGFHFIVGRVKDMIRRSSENIAAREVEAVLMQMDAVEEAAVIGVPDADRGQEVKACLVLKPGLGQADLPPEAVFAHCAAQLARFKVPRFLEYRASLPKTPSQKIAKHVLVAERPDLREGAIDRLRI